MDAFEFEELVSGLGEIELSELDGNIDMGPWGGCTYVFRIKVQGSHGPLGVVGEFNMDDDGLVSEVADFHIYDLSELPEDAEVDEGEELPEESSEYGRVYAQIAAILGFDCS